ncbi:MAG: hypothetical protein PWQ88_621 [Candidatus Methanomethylophilaceae archaeon]|nr:hypothetical protein [Candidatus Methanomethylophilaceae archaeon]MDI3541544.1 hypothetical protein [Candidatus Methanomethylophilaceae archaeon]
MVVIVYHNDLISHNHWKGHPESPMRLQSLQKRLERENELDIEVSAEKVTEEDLLRIHSQRMIDVVKAGKEGPLDPDMMLKEDTFSLACLSAGVAVEAARRAMDGEIAIALTRPPGHHAGPDYSSGFCYFNNVALAAELMGVRTVIVDIDAHHGNGTQDIFYDRDDVLYISIHEEGIFPGTGSVEEVGEGRGEGFNVNIPLPPGAGNRTYLEAMGRIIEPIIRQYSPELLIVSLGVDAHYVDEQSDLHLNTQTYLSLCKRLIDLAPNGRLAFVLEGGYHLRATAEVVYGIIAYLHGKEMFIEYCEESEEPLLAKAYLDRAVAVHSRYWKL